MTERRGSKIRMKKQTLSHEPLIRYVWRSVSYIINDVTGPVCPLKIRSVVPVWLIQMDRPPVRPYPAPLTIDSYQQRRLADDVPALRCINVIFRDFRVEDFPNEHDRLALVPVPLGLGCFCLGSWSQLHSSARRE